MDYKEYFKKNKTTLSDKQIVAIKLGGLITAARLYCRLSQTELAKKIGTQQPSLARAENGEVVPSVEFLYKIAKALKTDFIFPSFGFMSSKEMIANSRSEIKSGVSVETPYFDRTESSTCNLVIKI